MVSLAQGSFALAGILFCVQPAASQTSTSRPPTARELIEGCQTPPREQAVAQMAAAVGATPYSEARRQRQLTTKSVDYPESGKGEFQRTKTTVTAFRGWDLPGQGAGNLEYQEHRSEIVTIDRSTGEALTPLRVSVARSCALTAPVQNARTVFESYEGLSEKRYGLRVSADRRWVDAFMFDPDVFDIELSFTLKTPLVGVPPADEDGRLQLSDGGARFINSVVRGVPTVMTTRAGLLAGLDQPATMHFINMEIEPIVQRLATVP
jgi:hypothetical protein